MKTPITQLTHKRILTNSINLHVVEAGKPGKPLIVFLHGFPEFWYAWRYQIDFFAEAGYRVIAPDQRGYNLSDKPKCLKAYNLDELAKDIVGLIDAYGCEKAFVVAHDWGGMVAWWLAMKFPLRLEKLVAMNVPHPKVIQRNLKTNPTQRKRSRYVFMFQLPWLPEWRMRKDDWDYSTRALARTGRPGTFSDADIALYRDSWAQPGAMTGMINWYRAAVRHRPPWPESLRVTVPTLLIWGAKDRFLGREMAQPSIDLCDDGRLEFIEEASHWVQHEEPEKVNGMVREFLLDSHSNSC